MDIGLHEDGIDVAEDYCRDKIEPFYIRYAHVLFKQKQYGKMETIVLKAQKPEVAVELYKVGS